MLVQLALIVVLIAGSFLSACQFGITLCSIGLGLAGEPAVAELLGLVLEPLGRAAPAGPPKPPGGHDRPADHELTENVFTFGDRRAREAMVPGPEVELFTVDQSLPEAIDQVNGANRSHTRFPLCQADGGLDTALGSSTPRTCWCLRPGRRGLSPRPGPAAAPGPRQCPTG